MRRTIYSNTEGAIALAQKIRSLRRTRSRSERLCKSVQQSLNHRASWRQDARAEPTQFPRGGPVIYANTCVNNEILYTLFLEAGKLGTLIERVQRELTDADL